MAISRYENFTHRCHVIIPINNSKHFRAPNIFNMRSFCSQQWLGVREAPVMFLTTENIILFDVILYYIIHIIHIIQNIG